MPATVQNLSPPLPTLTTYQIRESILVAGTALGSFCALLLELTLTRLFSVVLFYHFAFLAISIALLGLGAGGVYAHIWKPRLRAQSTRRLAARCSLLNAVLIPVVLEIVLHVPVSLDLSLTNFFRLSVIYVCSAVPFFLTGLQFSIIFSRESSRVTNLYGADFSGGALACLAVVPLLNWLGAPNAILFAALTSAVAAVLLGRSGSFTESRDLDKPGLGSVDRFEFVKPINIRCGLAKRHSAQECGVRALECDFAG